VPTQSDGSFPQAIENHFPLELARPLEWPVSFMRSSGVTPALASPEVKLWEPERCLRRAAGRAWAPAWMEHLLGRQAEFSILPFYTTRPKLGENERQWLSVRKKSKLNSSPCLPSEKR